MTLTERYMAAIRAQIAELRELVAETDIPDAQAQAILANLDLMDQVAEQYE